MSIYLDHGASAFPKPPGVAQAVATFLDEAAGNPGRGGHRLAVAAARAVESARMEVASLIGSEPEKTVLGPGATFWLNTVISSFLAQGDRVVVSSLEHNAVMRPLRHLERDRGIQVAVVQGSDRNGVPSPLEIAAKVAESPTALVILNHASNVSGAVLDVAEAARRIAPTPVVVDAAQSAGSLPLDFSSLGVAALVCSGHKGLLGPPGTGVLALAAEVEIEPLVRGGTGSRSESEEMPTFLPDRLEAGTVNSPGIVGLGTACSWLRGQSIEAIFDHGQTLVQTLADDLREIPGIRLHGWKDGEPHTSLLSFTLDGADIGELAKWLDYERGIMLRAGLHCAPSAHRRLGTYPDGTLRVGIGPFNTREDIDILIRAVADFQTGRR